jgi:hypothetical protein
MVKEGGDALNFALSAQNLSEKDILAAQAYLNLSPEEQRKADEERWAQVEFDSKSGAEKLGIWALANTYRGLSAVNRGIVGFADFVWPDFLTPKGVQDGLDSFDRRDEQAEAWQEEVNGRFDSSFVEGAGQVLEAAATAAPELLLAIASGGSSLLSYADDIAKIGMPYVWRTIS